MTTASKLRLGFGTLIALFALSSMMTVFRFQSLRKETTEQVGIARDRRNEAVLLVLYVESFDLAVRTYTQTGDKTYLEQAGQRAGDVEQHFDAYKKLARTDLHQKFVDRFATLWPPVKTRGDAIAHSTSPDKEQFVRLAQERSDLERFLVYEVVAEALTTYEEGRSAYYQSFQQIAASALLLLLLGVGVAALTSWVVGRGIVKGEHEIRAGQERLRVTLSSIGDAVISTDTENRVVFMNGVAESLTGWKHQEAKGRPLSEVFVVVNEMTRKPVEIPSERALREGVVVGLANHTVLIAKDGTECPLDDSAAPIFDENGTLVGTVLVFRDIVDRKQAEAAMSHLAAIVTSSNDAIVSKDLNGTITSWNDGARRLFGYMAAEVIGKPVTILIPPDHLDEETRILGQIKRGESIAIYDTVRRRKDGSLVDVSLTVSPIRDAAGNIVGASKNARDITAEKQAGKALQDSHARFSTLFENSPVGMYLVDDEMKIRMASRNARSVFEDIPELIGKDFQQVLYGRMPADAADEILAHFLRTLKTGEPHSAQELSTERYDQTNRKYYDWQIHRITLPDGQFGVVCYFFDITEFVLARQAMFDSEVRYRRMFESAHDGILIVDAKSGEIIDANTYILALLGIEHEDLVGKHLFDLGIKAGIETVEDGFKELQQSGFLRQEASIRNKRGQNVQIDIMANVYHEGDRLVAQYSVRDIRDRFQMESKIKQQAEILAGESRRKDEFLAMLSHELRNPLAPIRSAVYLLKMHEQGENAIQRQAREIIERQVANLTKLVSDLLDVSRVVSGRIRLNLQTLDLKQVLDHAIQTAAPIVGQRKHELIVNSCNDKLWINADSTRIEEILINLLSNAAKYTDEGGRIEVTCEQREGDDCVELRIRDNGIGIEPKLLPRIFDLFTQSERSLERSDGGLGIGLNLAYRLVELHGGTIEAYSPPPGATRGSEFVVRLPAALAPDGSLTTEPSEDAVSTPKGRRVLVVDDNLDQAMMLTGTLRHKGYTVQSAHTGPDGLKAALHWKPDILVLDIGLPGLNGYEVARRVRSALAKDSVPMKLIALTGYGRDTDVALAHEAGFDIHLTKPCDFDELEKLLTTS